MLPWKKISSQHPSYVPPAFVKEKKTQTISHIPSPSGYHNLGIHCLAYTRGDIEAVDSVICPTSLKSVGTQATFAARKVSSRKQKNTFIG